MEKSIRVGMLWNAGGNLYYLLSQFLVTVFVSTLFAGYGEAGVLTLAMTVSATAQTIAMFGVRNFQVADVENKYADKTYLYCRVVTCTCAFLFCFLYALVKGYADETLVAILLFMVYRLSEDFADVLHGMAQKRDRLDVAGKSFAIKATVTLATFWLGYLLTERLLVCIAVMAVGSCVCTALYDWFAVKKIAAFSQKTTFADCKKLSLETVPMFLYLLAYTFAYALPKLMIEETYGTEALGGFQCIFTPATIVVSAIAYIYLPFLKKIAVLEQNGDKKQFAKTVLAIVGMTFGFAAVVFLGAYLFGDFAYTLVYGAKVTDYLYLMMPVMLSIYPAGIICFFSSLLIIQKKPVALVLTNVLAYGLTRLFITLFFDRFGMSGAPYGTALGLSIACVVQVFIIILNIVKKDLQK